MIKIIEGKKLMEEGLDKYLPRSKQQLDSIKESVIRIVDDVKENGDAALRKYCMKFDKVNLDHAGLKVTDAEVERAYELVDDKLIQAIKKAVANIEKFHKAQLRDFWSIETMPGVKTGQVLRPIESVGIYVPGGRAAYPSTVLMTAVPAKAAGVKKLIICSPPSRSTIKEEEYVGIHPSIIVAAHECGVHDLYKIGSAWAIAAMAYGTETVSSVLKIIGPGNKYVNAAKLLVKDIVSIDSPAGPSEVAIIADETANPEYIAYDLVSQVEHDPDNVGVLLSMSDTQIDQVIQNLEEIVEKSPRSDIIKESLDKYGLIIKSVDLNEMIDITNAIATEHLQILTKDPKAVLPSIKNAGAIFLGENSPVPLGDYCAGTNHVLPTGGSAERFSGLNTLEFMKIIDVLECSRNGLESLEKILTPLAEFEGLYGHRDAVKARLKNKKSK